MVLHQASGLGRGKNLDEPANGIGYSKHQMMKETHVESLFDRKSYDKPALRFSVQVQEPCSEKETEG